MKIYVGNLSWNTNNESLKTAFSAFGEVTDSTVITDRMTGRSRGFGFVEMTDDEAAKKAIADMDGKDLDGRALKVNEARPKTEGGPRNDAPRSY